MSNLAAIANMVWEKKILKIFLPYLAMAALASVVSEKKMF